MREPPAATILNGIVADLTREVLHARDGTAIALRPQSFAVLRHLIANPNRLVGKDELMQAVWGDLAVTDDSLVQCIHEIRRALDDGGRSLLRTVPRRGYRLVVPGGDDAPAPRPVARRAAVRQPAATPGRTTSPTASSTT